MSIKNTLLVKYGLKKSPSDLEIELWLSNVETFISSGLDKEEAGRKAAEKVFPDYNSAVYASEADTIEALLAALKNKGKNQSGS